MIRPIMWVSNTLGSGSPQTMLRNICTLVVKRSNSTVAAAQTAVDDFSNAKPYEQMPGPKPLPVLGNAWRFFPGGDLAKLDFAEQMEHFLKKYGRIVKFAGLPYRPDMVFLFDPNEIEKVYRNEGPWPIRDTIGSLHYYRTVTRKDWYGGVGGAVVKQGEEWQKFRTKMNPTMMQPRATKIYVAPIDAVANDFLERIRILKDENQEMPSNFVNEFHKWALESVVYLALDRRLGCFDKDLKPDSEPQKMIDAVQVMLDSMYKLDLKPSLWRAISTPAWRNFVKSSDYFTQVALKYIDQAKERIKNLPKDSDRELTVLEKLIARDPNPNTSMVMAMDMMLAGVDSTAFATITTLYYLATNPEKQQILFEEIKKHMPDKNQPITSGILNELKYLKACSKESMRMRPVAIGNMRKLVKDMVLSDYKVPKGTDIIMPNYVLCNMEEYFPQADKYIPERWLKQSDGEKPDTKMTHPFVYMPFGFGPRMCLGRRFAELEMETLITKIVRNFHVEYNYEMKFKSGLLYKPASPLKFKFLDRE